ncbi:class I adenylate-forming enzyme family protein [Francisella sp. 19X1-34]|uniref:class I adenylate-forming enzyme family protein n=1 Tax=Francisella sp. 19X1-34 TaxID=3087177 RepID=UPI002E2F86BA|nr:class I adenylate-forming enzyme family protein [Francisella sp. 19X1-34]MED7787843.1 class I adenylate-forming enzyme family protein [Francisella sp. 19X1-34]
MDFFFRHLNLDSESVISSSSNEFYSYKTLFANIIQASHYFKKNNITNIVFCVKNSYGFLYSFLGALHAGVDVSILHADYPYETILSVASKLETDLVVYDNYDEKILFRGFDIESMFQVTRNIESGESNYSFKREFHQASKKGQIILGSSGTTGEPKLIKHDFKSLISTIKSYTKVLSINFRDQCIIARAMSHISGLGEVISCVLAGCSFLILEDLNSTSIIENIISYKPSYISLSPSVVYELLAKAEHNIELRRIFNKTRKVRAGGGYISEDIITRFYECFRVKLETLYGATECSPIMYNYQKNDKKKASLGKPIDGVNVKILDKYNLQKVKDGDVGELYIQSESLFKSYLSGSTNIIANQDDWYCTQDLVRKDEDGYYWFISRANDLIQKSNESIFPIEIEEAMIKHDKIVSCVTVAKSDFVYNFVPVAWYKTKDHIPLSKEDLLQHLSKYIRKFIMPNIFHHCIEFPMLSNGKEDRKKIAKISESLI